MMTIGEAYYTALGAKNINEVEKYLHQDVQFSDPQETVNGRKSVLEAANRFMNIFHSLTIRTKLASEDQVMIVYEVMIQDKPLKAASLLSFQDGLISKIELFYDMSHVNRKSPLE